MGKRKSARLRWAGVLTAITALTGALVTTPPPPEAAAASASDFDAGNLISDANFFDGAAMTAAQVQAFLQEKRPSCDAGYTCLPSYSQSTPSMGATRFCDAMAGSTRASAAEIIARVGAACRISQRVLIVLIEKEQSLITSRRPVQRQYDRATGFACPDTAPCDPAFGGFFYQVYNAGQQFQRYAAFPGNYNHRAGVVNSVLYHPNAACGSSQVRIANQATAGLYNYTPYVPNAAALDPATPDGDACSAFGNRNFWLFYETWFGEHEKRVVAPAPEPTA